MLTKEENEKLASIVKEMEPEFEKQKTATVEEVKKVTAEALAAAKELYEQGQKKAAAERANLATMKAEAAEVVAELPLCLTCSHQGRRNS